MLKSLVNISFSHCVIQVLLNKTIQAHTHILEALKSIYKKRIKGFGSESSSGYKSVKRWSIRRHERAQPLPTGDLGGPDFMESSNACPLSCAALMTKFAQ